MTALEASHAETDPDFLARVKYYIVCSAVAVTTEVTVHVLHTERLALAVKILRYPLVYAPQFALAAMSNLSLKAQDSLSAIPDPDLEYTVNQVYDSFVNV